MKAARLVGILALAACSKGSADQAIRPDPDGWQCFARDPAEPASPDGQLEVTRQRFLADRIEADSVFAAGDQGAASRLVLTKAGDHFEQHLTHGSITQDVTARLLQDDGSHWTLSIKQGESGHTADEDSVVAGDVLTVTSMHDGTRTVTRLLRTSCDDVVAALARFP